MRTYIGEILILLVLMVSLLATAADKNLPPITKDRAELDAFFQKTVAENPWMAGTQIANSMANFRDIEQNFLPGLVALDQYQELVKLRGDFVTLHIEVAKEVVVRTPVLTANVLDRIKSETVRTLRSINIPAGQSPIGVLDEAIRARLGALTHSDPRGILTGLINCLPRESRAPYFKNPQLREILEALQKDPNLTDEAVRANFKGDAHRIAAGQISRERVLAHVTELLDRESELVSFLQARWFLARAEGSVAATHGEMAELERLITASPSEAFDINEAEEMAARTFFGQILSLAPPAKDLQRKAENYLGRVEQQWRDAERAFEERKEKRGEPYLTVRELPAYIVSHRGVLTGDCGTRDDYALIFSPLERNFYIFDAQGKVIGYVGATHIHTNNQPTFYVHDITGHGVSQEMRNQIANSFYVVRKKFGADVMSLGLIGYAPYTYPLQTHVANQYLDTKVRDYLAPFCANPHGDRPADNPHSAIFEPHPETLAPYLVRLEGQAVPRPVQKAPASKKEILTQFLDLTGGGQNMEVPLNHLPIKEEELQRMGFVLRNDDRLPLKAHYERLSALFTVFELPLSEKFIGKHETFFIRGHLEAVDALLTTDLKMRDRTVEYVLAIIRRGNDRELGYTTIAASPTFFAESERFKNYLAEMPLNNPENLIRLGRIIRAGVPSLSIAPSAERLQQLTEVQDIHIQTWAITQWFDRKNPLTLPMIQTLGTALKNDKHETDDTSIAASRILAVVRTDDAEVNKSLGKSLSREENFDIAYSAGLALIRNGVPLPEIRKLIAKSKIHDQLTKHLTASGELPPAGPDEAVCADEVNRQAPK